MRGKLAISSSKEAACGACKDALGARGLEIRYRSSFVAGGCSRHAGSFYVMLQESFHKLELEAI